MSRWSNWVAEKGKGLTCVSLNMEYKPLVLFDRNYISKNFSMYSEFEMRQTQKNRSKSFCVMVLICAHYLTCSNHISSVPHLSILVSKISTTSA